MCVCVWHEWCPFSLYVCVYSTPYLSNGAWKIRWRSSFCKKWVYHGHISTHIHNILYILYILVYIGIYWYTHQVILSQILCRWVQLYFSLDVHHPLVTTCVYIYQCNIYIFWNIYYKHTTILFELTICVILLHQIVTAHTHTHTHTITHTSKSMYADELNSSKASWIEHDVF